MKIYSFFMKSIQNPLYTSNNYTGRFNKNIPVCLLGRLQCTMFEARNCISEPGLQELYRDICIEHPVN
jgi:hypothetical protein